MISSGVMAVSPFIKGRENRPGQGRGDRAFVRYPLGKSPVQAIRQAP